MPNEQQVRVSQRYETAQWLNCQLDKEISYQNKLHSAPHDSPFGIGILNIMSQKTTRKHTDK